ncbi:unnamed protein product [Amoebophrya sp. A120]|nr:unnamed protein product [Amoebophrya sp. A120]|eukprot:GSA120T00007460001.1
MVASVASATRIRPPRPRAAGRSVLLLAFTSDLLPRLLTASATASPETEAGQTTLPLPVNKNRPSATDEDFAKATETLADCWKQLSLDERLEHAERPDPVFFSWALECLVYGNSSADATYTGLLKNEKRRNESDVKSAPFVDVKTRIEEINHKTGSERNAHGPLNMADL